MISDYTSYMQIADDVQLFGLKRYFIQKDLHCSARESLWSFQNKTKSQFDAVFSSFDKGKSKVKSEKGFKIYLLNV